MLDRLSNEGRTLRLRRGLGNQGIQEPKDGAVVFGRRSVTIESNGQSSGFWGIRRIKVPRPEPDGPVPRLDDPEPYPFIGLRRAHGRAVGVAPSLDTE